MLCHFSILVVLKILTAEILVLNSIFESISVKYNFFSPTDNIKHIIQTPGQVFIVIKLLLNAFYHCVSLKHFAMWYTQHTAQ